jgi:L-amino acid N-acyltransferase YncA
MKIGFNSMNSIDRQLKLRKVTQDDCELLWKWANDPIVRAASFSSEPITWEEHLSWFNSKLNSSNCYHFIAFDVRDEPIGQVRFDLDKQLQSVVSISLASNRRSQGYGKLMLKMAIEELSKCTLVNNIQAFIKADNFASIKLFKSLEFTKECAELTSLHNRDLCYVYKPKQDKTE